jgi:hypothetical protein
MSGQGPRSLEGLAAALLHLVDQPFPTSDQVLLCSFDSHLREVRTTRQLRSALIAAGFLPRASNYLVQVSPLLRRVGRGRHEIRPFDREWAPG